VCQFPLGSVPARNVLTFDIDNSHGDVCCCSVKLYHVVLSFPLVLDSFLTCSMAFLGERHSIDNIFDTG
jgi:hypothetical protein